MVSSNTIHPKITSMGQVTIPATIRNHLGVKQGDRVQFIVVADGSVKVAPAPSHVLTTFGVVRPLKKPEDFKALREAFEEGVAASVIAREK